MSVKNTKGLAFAILNDGGYYDLYDPKGNKVEIPKVQIRITQVVNEHDKMLLIFPVNVVRNEEEMKKILNP